MQAANSLRCGSFVAWPPVEGEGPDWTITCDQLPGWRERVPAALMRPALHDLQAHFRNTWKEDTTVPEKKPRRAPRRENIEARREREIRRTLKEFGEFVEDVDRVRERATKALRRSA